MQTDVLVIGAGAAGLSAALAARENTTQVTVVSKSRANIGSTTALTTGTFKGAIGGHTQEDHYDETVEAGRDLSDLDLVRALVEDTPQRIQALFHAGVPLDIFPGGADLEGHHIEPSPGKKITGRLWSQAVELGIDFLERCLVVDLLTDEGQIAGALLLKGRSREFIAIQAKAVVVATGGLGGIYSKSTNPRQNTGDGQAFILRAGGTLRDMEFVQFVPFGIAEPSLPAVLVPAEVLDHIPLVNSQGKEFLRDFLRSWGIEQPSKIDRFVRDYATRLMWEQTATGQRDQDGVFLQLSSVRPEQWQIPEMSYLRKYVLRGWPLEQAVQVAPLAHFTIGGVSIAANGATSIAGLFAAGEVTGGLHGANRLGGNALSEALVFGARAGLAATNYAMQTGSPCADRIIRTPLAAQIERLRAESGSFSLRTLRRKLRDAVDEGIGPGRSQRSLQAFLEQRDALQSRTEKIRIQTERDLREYVELQNMLVVSQAIARSALVREESRGAHYRTDFPRELDRFSHVHTTFTLNEGVSFSR